MTADNFNAWGWRIFFVIGFLVALVGLIIRTRTMDSSSSRGTGAGRSSQISVDASLARDAADNPAPRSDDGLIRRRSG
jgi:hypothetical protein